MNDILTQSDKEYIEYFMWRHEGQMTAKEIAQELHIRKETVYSIAREHGIKIIWRNDNKPDICAGRPAACFNCPASECRYTGRQTDEELAYLFAGISLAEPKKKAKSKKRQKARA